MSKQRQKTGLKLKEETSKMKHWDITLYGAEIWTLRKVHQKYMEDF
jgi:hypothetical protein